MTLLWALTIAANVIMLCALWPVRNRNLIMMTLWLAASLSVDIIFLCLIGISDEYKGGLWWCCDWMVIWAGAFAGIITGIRYSDKALGVLAGFLIGMHTMLKLDEHDAWINTTVAQLHNYALNPDGWHLYYVRQYFKLAMVLPICAFMLSLRNQRKEQHQ